MRISEAFPSNYLKAADLQGRQIPVKIKDVIFETIGQGQQQETRPIVYFEGKEKGLVLNKTNANTVAAVYGDDTDDWVGGDIILFEAMVDYQGRSVPAIRLKVPPRRPVAAQQTKQPARQQQPSNEELIDDSVPF